MVDREKVIKGLEHHLKELSVGKTCFECPYCGDSPCEICLITDALALLKEQDQSTRPIYNGRYWECEQCGEKYKDILAVKEYKHCPGCGRRIEWQG